MVVVRRRGAVTETSTATWLLISNQLGRDSGTSPEPKTAPRSIPPNPASVLCSCIGRSSASDIIAKLPFSTSRSNGEALRSYRECQSMGCGQGQVPRKATSSSAPTLHCPDAAFFSMRITLPRDVRVHFPTSRPPARSAHHHKVSWLSLCRTPLVR
jgi:hypothetical protein